MSRPRITAAAITPGPRQRHAQDALRAILAGNIPSARTLQGLYGAESYEEVGHLIGWMLETHLKGMGAPRKHMLDAPTELHDMRSTVSRNKNSQHIQSALLRWQLPEAADLRHFYGEYADVVRSTFDRFLTLRLKRKCGISSTAHLNRVGVVVWALGMDDDETHRYSAIGALHDAIEDLLYRVKDENEKLYGIGRYQEFVDTLIPPELQPSVMLLTNHYDLVLGSISYAFQREQIYFSHENLQKRLARLEESDGGILRHYLRSMIDLFESIDLGSSVYETAKWLCYERLYIPKLAEASLQEDNWRLFQLKAIDLTDNFHGREALAMERQIRNIIKMTIWAKQGYAVKSTWGPLNNHIMEVQEDSLDGAELIVLRDLLQQQSFQDFVVSGLLKVKELRQVLYIG